MCATTNRLKLCSFVKNVKKTTTRQNILIVSLKAWAKNGAQLLIYLVLKSEKFMQKRMRKSRFSLNCLVRSETSRHVQICFVSAKQCAQLQIAKNEPLWQKREENNNLAKIAYSFTATLWEKTPPKHKFTQTALIGQKRASHFSISHFCAKQSAQLRIA